MTYAPITPPVDRKNEPVLECTWFVVLMLALSIPVGLYLVWKSSHWAKSVKIVCTLLAAFFLVSSHINKQETWGLSAIPKNWLLQASRSGKHLMAARAGREFSAEVVSASIVPEPMAGQPNGKMTFITIKNTGKEPIHYVRGDVTLLSGREISPQDVRKCKDTGVYYSVERKPILPGETGTSTTFHNSSDATRLRVKITDIK